MPSPSSSASWSSSRFAVVEQQVDRLVQRHGVEGAVPGDRFEEVVEQPARVHADRLEVGDHPGGKVVGDVVLEALRQHRQFARGGRGQDLGRQVAVASLADGPHAHAALVHAVVLEGQVLQRFARGAAAEAVPELEHLRAGGAERVDLLLDGLGEGVAAQQPQPQQADDDPDASQHDSSLGFRSGERRVVVTDTPSYPLESVIPGCCQGRVRDGAESDCPGGHGGDRG